MTLLGYIFTCFSIKPYLAIFKALINSTELWVWSGVAKVSCSLRHRGFQLIFAYSWATLAILVAG